MLAFCLFHSTGLYVAFNLNTRASRRSASLDLPIFEYVLYTGIYTGMGVEGEHIYLCLGCITFIT